MDNKSNDLMSEIISNLNTEVKNFNSFVSNNIPEKPNLPEMMLDHITTTVPNKIEYFDKQWKENDHITGINQAYAKLKEKAEVGLIDDSFCTTNNKEPKSGTARSFVKTLDAFNRYYTIVQASN